MFSLAFYPKILLLSKILSDNNHSNFPPKSKSIALPFAQKSYYFHLKFYHIKITPTFHQNVNVKPWSLLRNFALNQFPYFHPQFYQTKFNFPPKCKCLAFRPKILLHSISLFSSTILSDQNHFNFPPKSKSIALPFAQKSYYFHLKFYQIKITPTFHQNVNVKPWSLLRNLALIQFPYFHPKFCPAKTTSIIHQNVSV